MKIFLLLITLLISNSLLAQVLPTTVGHIGEKPVVLRNGEPVLFKGIQYWGLDHWNEGHWEEDIKNIKKLGLNGIRLNIAWDHIEAKEGVFTFEKLDQLLDLIEENDLSIVLQLNQSAHAWKPVWFEQKYTSKELLVKDVNGKNQYDRLSFSSAPFKKHYYNYVRNTVAHLKDRQSIIAYSVYTEPHFADKEQWLDYNKHSREGFKNWLRGRYESIEQLNTAWHTNFGSFGKVEPYREVPNSDWNQMPDEHRKQFGDWNLWNCVAKAEFIGGLIAECKKIDKEHLYIQNMMWKWSGKYGANVALDPEINYAYADIIGINVYPYGKNAYKVGASVNFIRSMFRNTKPVWLGEFSTKSGNATEEELSAMLGEAFKLGCTGFVYFTYNGQAEKGGEEYGIEHYGILDRNRKKKDAFYELQDYLKHEVTGEEKTILETPIPEAKVNFLWPQMNKIYAYLSEEFNFDMYVSAFNLTNMDSDLPVNVITEKQLIHGEYDKSLPLLVPSMPMTNKKVAGALKKQIKNEGLNVLIAGRFGNYYFNNQKEVTNKGNTRLDSYLGLGFKYLKKGNNKARLKMEQDYGELKTNDSVIPKFDKIAITQTEGLTPLAKWPDGTIAMGLQPLGKGEILYVGSHFFKFTSSATDSARVFNKKVLQSFVEESNKRDQVTSLKQGKKKKKKRLIRLDDKKYTVDLIGEYTFQVVNFDGRLLASSSEPRMHRVIDLKNLSSGKYLIKIRTHTDQQTDIIVVP
ncbi:beta-galactosidase [Flammeovirga aprica]|uniref:Cellulase family glycosylhydrolase n=1 Tax=Flammeovirga aprica JL-4 TaxID=694437 RepID=A0A7X9XBT8_9BACT|nr:beta-galactosidase [Flammeovirga aprica]NME71023.1 cellulase family glycosylhydrolase [Flammeovirga aprica JL-4]